MDISLDPARRNMVKLCRERQMPSVEGFKVNVDVDSQVRTDDGSKIDLQILGSDWSLLIENKIYSPLGNPLGSYEAHATRLRAKTFFSILSPDGQSAAGWTAVSYQAFCQTHGLYERSERALLDIANRLRFQDASYRRNVQPGSNPGRYIQRIMAMVVIGCGHAVN